MIAAMLVVSNRVIISAVLIIKRELQCIYSCYDSRISMDYRTKTILYYRTPPKPDFQLMLHTRMIEVL